MHIFKHKFVAIVLWPFSFLYYLVILMRNWAYDVGIFKTFSLNAKIISIGNISVGGTGKTPATIFLASAIQNAGYRVAILSRGYGRVSKANVLVSTGAGPLCHPSEAGDEPCLMAQKTHGIPILVDRDRVHGGELLIEQFSPDVIVLDDGFQHRRLRRDLDIVLLEKPQGNFGGFLLPAGPFREPISSLKRAHFTFLAEKSTVRSTQIDAYQKKINRHSRSTVYPYQKKIQGIIFPEIGERQPATLLEGKRIIALSGIANPLSFQHFLNDAGALIVREYQLKDHAVYDQHLVDTIIAQYHETQAEMLITTEKDWVKLSSFSELRELKVGLLEIAFHTEYAALQDILQQIRGMKSR